MRRSEVFNRACHKNHYNSREAEINEQQEMPHPEYKL